MNSNVNGLVQVFGISSALATEMMQSCAEPAVWKYQLFNFLTLQYLSWYSSVATLHPIINYCFWHNRQGAHKPYWLSCSLCSYITYIISVSIIVYFLTIGSNKGYLNFNIYIYETDDTQIIIIMYDGLHNHDSKFYHVLNLHEKHCFFDKLIYCTVILSYSVYLKYQARNTVNCFFQTHRYVNQKKQKFKSADNCFMMHYKPLICQIHMDIALLKLAWCLWHETNLAQCLHWNRNSCMFIRTFLKLTMYPHTLLY